EKNCSCPTCKQDLPKEQVEETERRFNINKAEKLEEIVKAGNSKKSEKELIEEETEKLEIKIADLEKEIQKQEKKIIAIQVDLKGVETNRSEFEENGTYVAKRKQKEELEDEMLSLMDSENEEVAKKNEIIYDLEADKNEIASKLNKLAYFDKAKKRIEDLEAE